MRLLAAASRRSSFRGQVRLLRFLLPPDRLTGLHTSLRLSDGRRFHIAADEYIEWYLFLFGPYEPEITSLLSLLTDQSSVVVDVGANIGVHTLTMAALAPGGKVFACEPHPVTVERLRANLALNVVGNVEILQIALLDQERRVSLYDNNNKGMATLHSYDGWNELSVWGTTLDEVVRSQAIPTIDVIKIDVEGYEAPVLAGASAILARDRPSIIFEYVDWAWQNCGFPLGETLDQLRSIGYEQFYLVEPGGLSPLPEPLAVSGNILAVGRTAQRTHVDMAAALARRRAARGR